MRTDAANLARRLRRWLDDAAETWLGYALPPADRAVVESGWTADGPGAFCHRCGDSVGAGEMTPGGCTVCRGTRPPFAAVVRLGPYEPPLRDWVVGIKYDGWAEMAEELGRHLGRSVRLAGCVDLARAVVVPMPMPLLRRIYRGIDHAAVIAEAVATELQVPMVSLLRIGHGPPQVTLPASTRRRGRRRRPRLRRWPRRSMRDSDVILVDDVRTTGTTLRRASRAIRSLGPHSTVAAVLAVADDPTRRKRREPLLEKGRTAPGRSAAIAPHPPVLRPMSPPPDVG